MNENFINEAAKLYYKEHVEGEPLNHETPIECFIAGAKFLHRAMKIYQNNCNISNYSPYNHKNINMDDILNTDKFLINVEKIIKVTGFHVTAPGDESVGIFPATWEIKNDFYFDNQKELDIFKFEIKSLFEFYCGEVTNVITFEEQNELEQNELEHIEYKGYLYWYEYKLAKHRVDMCLATKNPKKYCNGFYLFSTKDEGNGKAFVIVKTNNPNKLIND